MTKNGQKRPLTPSRHLTDTFQTSYNTKEYKKTGKNGQKRPKTIKKRVKTAKNGQKVPTMAKNRPKNGQKWPKMTKNDQKLLKMRFFAYFYAVCAHTYIDFFLQKLIGR